MDWKLFLYIPLFAIAAALLYLWGLARSRDKEKTLSAMLVGKSEKILKKHLRTAGSLTPAEAERLLTGVSVKLFYQKERFGVTDASAFSKAVLERMEKLNMIQKAADDSFVLTEREQKR